MHAATDTAGTVARVGAALVARSWTMGVAESLTAGAVQAAIGALSGASAFYCGGVVAYSVRAKHDLLGVDRSVAAEANGVSIEVARQMASGVRDALGCDVGLAVTGYAEPYAPRGITVPFAAWAIVAPTIGEADTGWLDGEGFGRVAMQQHVTATVLARLAELVSAGADADGTG